MKKQSANFVTCSRIVFSISLMFCEMFSLWFYLFYLICGLTDIFDGCIARKTGTVSTIGSKFDTVADFIFFSAVAIKLYPVIDVFVWVIGWIILIASIKTVAVIVGYIRKKQLVVQHTMLNRITGVVLFFLPLAMKYINFKFLSVVVCALATVASLQEVHDVLSKSSNVGANKT